MARANTLASLGEFGFLERLFPTLATRRDVVVGPGDDCAVVRCGKQRILITTDVLVEGVHFRHAWMTPRQLGRRSLTVNLSDIAAMGGRPTFCLISVGVPTSYPVTSLSAVHAGIEAAARAAGVAVVGGNVSSARRLFLSLTVLGEAGRRVVTRGGARVGDELYVTGTLGAAALGIRQLRRGRRLGAAVRRYREPQARLAAGALLAQRNVVSAMIDISDGLLQDLGHMTAASNVGAVLNVESLPCSSALRQLAGPAALQLALRGGEDYELLCAVPRGRVPLLQRLSGQIGCRITRIGRCVGSDRGIELAGSERQRSVLNKEGWDHFRRS
jgi:thiamine-monophosphate kinase